MATPPDDEQLQHLYQQIGMRIRTLRQERGWSQDTLAHLADLNRSYPYRIETGSLALRLSTLYRLAAAFDLPLHALLSGIDPTPTNGNTTAPQRGSTPNTHEVQPPTRTGADTPTPNTNDALPPTVESPHTLTGVPTRAGDT